MKSLSADKPSFQAGLADVPADASGPVFCAQLSGGGGVASARPDRPLAKLSGSQPHFPLPTPYFEPAISRTL